MTFGLPFVKHLFSPGNGVEPAISGADVVSLMDAAGIQRSVVISGGYWFSEKAKAQRENSYVAEQVAEYPSRLIGVCGVPPLAAWALSEIDRCMTKLKLKGIKIHPQHNGLDFTDRSTVDSLNAVLKRAAELNVPVIFDSVGWADKEVYQFFGMVFSHANLKVILAHSFLHKFRDLGILITLFKAYPTLPRNVFVDLSAIQVLYAGSPEEESLVWHLREIGIQNVLFGSDTPVFSPRASLEAFSKLNLTPEERQLILYKNAAGLYGLP